MKKKTTGFIAGAAGAALLMSGATYALWSDSADVDGATISSGNLEVEVANQWAWTDISADRTDDPQTIDLTAFKMIPGDTIQGTIGLDVALAGDNMVAALGTELAGASGDLTNLDIDVAVTDSTGAPVTLAGGQMLLASADNSNNVAALTQVGATTDGTADLTITVTVTFPASTIGQDHVNEYLTLDGATVTLDQVRAAAAGNGGF